MRESSKPWVIAGVIVAVMVAQAAYGQSATVEGTVSDSSGAVAGATVAVSNPAVGSRSPLVTGTTDGSGNYSVIVPMDAGATIDVVVEAASPNHAPTRHNWTGELSCFFDCGTGGEFSISDGDTISNKDIVLESGGTISGTVTAADSGNPLDGAQVRPYRATGFD